MNSKEWKSVTKSLKQQWVELPDDCFVPMTFSSLMVGEMFILLPWPGDNNGRGLRNKYNVFIKTLNNVSRPANGRLQPSVISLGRAINMANGVATDFLQDFPVVQIEMLTSIALLDPQK